MKKIHKPQVSICLLLALGFIAQAAPLDSAGHLRLADSSGLRYVTLRAALYDSLQLTDLGKSHRQNTSRFALRFDGRLAPEWTFISRVEVNTDQGDRTYPDNFYDPYDGLPYNAQGGGKRTYDAFSARTDWNTRYVSFAAGIDHLGWGPARRNSLVLRGDQSPWRPWQDTTLRLVRPAPMPFLGFDMELSRVRYTQYAAQLQHDKDKRKYLHAHRLDITLPYAVKLGLAETIVYGTTVEKAGSNPNRDGDSTGRTLESVYLLPFVPYVFAQHYVGDRDNTGLSGDLSVRTLRGWEFYGELLWDDMKSPLAMGDDSWWGNKWAASIGVAADPKHFGPLQWDWMAEYTHIEPWVYTHHLGASHRYTHFGQSLGSDLGPNAQEIYSRLGLRRQSLKLELHVSAVAKDTARGGNIDDIHVNLNELGIPADREDKTFLDEASTLRYQEYGAALSWQPWEWMWMRLGYALLEGDYEGYRLETSAGVTW